MVAVTTSAPFWDREAKVTRRAGETFDATAERAAEIQAALPGYVTVADKPAPKKAATRRRTAKPKE